jgi:nucleotide-binding universal stress UspA family protein
MRIEKVVVGIDFSRPAIEAAQWVARQLAPDAELLLAHVIDLPRTPSFLRGVAASDAELEATATSAAEPRLQELASLLTPARVRTVIRTGRTHEELAKLAAETGADLVAVGPHGDRPRPWKMLGTTAERLARAAAPAVLVVAQARSTPPRRVLVALDDTPIATVVLDWTKTIADTLGASVTAIHVLRGAATSHVLSAAASTAGGGEAHHATQVSPETLGEATRWLATLAHESLGRGRVESIVAHGHPGDAIVETARDVGADLIILGRRGRGTLIPAVAGSTVSTVLHGAARPVLVVTEEAVDWMVSEGE